MIRLTYVGEQLIGFDKGEDCPLSVKVNYPDDDAWILCCLKKSKEKYIQAQRCDFDNCQFCQRARTFREVQDDLDGMLEKYDDEGQ